MNGLFAEAYHGLAAQLGLWEGWAVLIAAALYGWRRGPLWMPAAVALVINPAPYGVVAAIAHGRPPGLKSAAVVTLLQFAIAVVGFAIGRLGQRFR